MRDTVGVTTKKLYLVINDLQSAVDLCRKFQKQLVGESETARFGWSISDCIDKQADGLEGDAEDLLFNLYSFKEEKISLDEDMLYL